MKLKKNRVLKSYRLAASAALHFQLEEAKEDISVIDIAPATGVITISTTPAAGGGKLLLVPFTGSITSPLALPGPDAASPIVNGNVQWKCLSKGAATFAGVAVPSDALDRKYAPSECK